VRELTAKVFKDDIIDLDSKTVLARKYEPLTEAAMKQMRCGYQECRVVDVSWDEGLLLKSLKADPMHTRTMP
jgi:hypothetical protein